MLSALHDQRDYQELLAQPGDVMLEIGEFDAESVIQAARRSSATKFLVLVERAPLRSDLARLRAAGITPMRLGPEFREFVADRMEQPATEEELPEI